jgi:hypothetical protein
MITSEKAIQKSMTLPRRSVNQSRLLVGVVAGGAGTLHHPRASRPAPLLISYNAAARLASRLPLRRDELRECGGLRNRPQFAQE